MGTLFEDEKKSVPSAVPLDPDEIAYERTKTLNRDTIVLSLIAAFLVGLFVADIDHRSILDPFMQRFSAALGTALGVLIFAGIPSAIAAKFTLKWRYVWLAITILLLTSQVVVHFYEGSKR